jgi:hypothetical protein
LAAVLAGLIILATSTLAEELVAAFAIRVTVALVASLPTRLAERLHHPAHRRMLPVLHLDPMLRPPRLASQGAFLASNEEIIAWPKRRERRKWSRANPDDRHGHRDADTHRTAKHHREISKQTCSDSSRHTPHSVRPRPQVFSLVGQSCRDCVASTGQRK